MTLTTQQLCDVFHDRAAAVHELVTFSYSKGLGVSEEAITDTLLVEMRRRLPPNHVVTRKFTKHEESSTSGADWLWVIGRPGRWLPILVQAKLARPGEPNLTQLHYKKGAQARKLVSYARSKRYVPLYVIYSGFTGSLPPASKSQKYKPDTWMPTCRLVRMQIEQMGCVVVRPGSVARMRRATNAKRSVMRLMNAGKPWSCLFCCPLAAGGGDLASVALAGVRQLPIAPKQESGQSNQDSDAPEDIDDIDDNLIHEQLPDIALAVAEGRDSEESPPFSAVTIISSEPLGLATRQGRG